MPLKNASHSTPTKLPNVMSTAAPLSRYIRLSAFERRASDPAFGHALAVVPVNLKPVRASVRDSHRILIQRLKITHNAS